MMLTGCERELMRSKINEAGKINKADNNKK
jgi:hypothetical protein